MAKVVVTSKDATGFETEVAAGSHSITIDQPTKFGGTDKGPNPHDAFLGMLGACVVQTLFFEARRQKYDLQTVTVTITETRVKDPNGSGKIPQITEDVELKGNLNAAQIAALERTVKRCPVYLLLTGAKVVTANVTHS
jgi:uncharacterized OsmC-like protein